MVRRNLNQGQLALALGLGQSELSKRLRCVTPFKFDEVVALAEFFDVSIGALFGEATMAGPRPGGPDGTLDSGGRHTTQEYSTLATVVSLTAA